MPTYKLIYFNVYGLAEPIRFIMKYGNIPFEDFRIMNKDVEWKAYKPKTPYGQIPVLEIDGKAYAQSIPICHYLAKQVNLLGNTDLDALEIDGIATTLSEFRKLASPYFFETDKEKKQQLQKNLIDNTIPFYMGKFESLAVKNGGHLHGKEMSYADLYLAAILDAMDNAVEKDVVADYPTLNKLVKKVREHPSIKNWLANRPTSVF